LDGWGIAPVWGGNAISLASPRVFTEITKRFPYTTLSASSLAVGLPEGSPGNSEAGHLNIGAGHIVHQDQPIIDRQIENGQFFTNPVLLGAIDHAKKNKSNIHLIGLLSKTGTHSQIKHAYALLKMLKQAQMNNVFIHLFTDGRDSDSMSGIEMLSELENETRLNGVGQISTIIGRFYAMDRDNRWDRVSTAYDLLTKGKGTVFNSAGEIFTKSYARGVTDEFIEPSIITNKGQHSEVISDNDAVIFFNFRSDRAKEITQAFLDPLVSQNIPNRKILYNLYFATFVMHGDNTLGHHVFVPEKVNNPLAQIWSSNRLRQYHTAETEKYAHVTYFFNGSQEKPFPGEDRVMIQSPKEYETYDKIPEMSSAQLTSTLINTINRNIHDCFVVNFANTDMVGHTGNLKATVRAVEHVDKCLGQVLDAVLSRNGVAFVFADHGNAEQMVNPRTGEPDTEHTINPVPFCIVGKEFRDKKLPLMNNGALANIAPTVLDIMNISYDKNLFANSLIIKP
jgi:2,3-bisphosphoglycerate-independent phosphoglycerate mutase